MKKKRDEREHETAEIQGADESGGAGVQRKFGSVGAEVQRKNGSEGAGVQRENGSEGAEVQRENGSEEAEVQRKNGSEGAGVQRENESVEAEVQRKNKSGGTGVQRIQERGRRGKSSGKGSRRSGGKSKAGRVCSAAGTILIILVILLCSLLVLPGMIGFHMYDVLSGSMEPAVPVGSLLYVREENVEEVEEKDIIAFYSSLEGGGVITHRVVENNVVSGTFATKGDANEEKDPTPIAYENYIGTVVLTVPYIGKLLTIMTSLYGKIAAGCVIGLGVILNLIGGRMEER